MALTKISKMMMFSDFICPFCYIGFETIRRLRSEFDFKLEWRGYQIHPEWPAEGMPSERFGGAEVRRAAWERIKALADSIDLPISPPRILSNSRLALEAAEFAFEAGKGEEFEARVFRAYFGEGANIGEGAVIGALAAETGIDRVELDGALKSGKYSLRLQNNSLDAHRRGLSGVPTLLINGFALAGAQSPDVMRQVIRRAAERIPTPAE